MFRDITTFGGAPFYFLITALFYLFNQTTVAIDLLIGFFFSLLVVIIIRTFYFKDRPQKHEHVTYIQKLDASSFPSWHTTRIVFMAILFIQFFNNTLLTVLFTITALVTTYSRIYLKKHDWTDLLGGIALAFLTYWIVLLI